MVSSDSWPLIIEPVKNRSSVVKKDHRSSKEASRDQHTNTCYPGNYHLPSKSRHLTILEVWEGESEDVSLYDHNTPDRSAPTILYVFLS